MKPIPDPDVILTFPLEDNETIVTYCQTSNLLTFTPAASDHVIKLDGEWPCISICMHNHRNITLDLEDFDAPDLTHIVGNKTLDIYNWNFERTYASHESVSPISTVRNIFNSRIIVSRPNDPAPLPHHNIVEIYGKMAFCELELDAPPGWKCIGTVQSYATIYDNNTFDPADNSIQTVPYPESETMVVTFTSPCPVETFPGSLPTFTAETNINAYFSFTINKRNQPRPGPQPGMEIEFTPLVIHEPGTYDVKVVARDVNDQANSDTETCIWTVIEPLAVTFSPSCPVATTSGSPPTFTATTNMDANITFYVNDSPILSYPNTREASYTPAAGFDPDTYAVKVVATDPNGVHYPDEETCTWIVYPPLAVELTSSYLDYSAPILINYAPVVDRLFTATTNRPANLQFFVDGEPKEVIYSNTLTAYFSFDSTEDEHRIEIVATTPCNEEVVTTSILWKKVLSSTPEPTHFKVLASDSCQEEGPVFTAEIAATLRRNNQLSLITINYDIDAITKCEEDEDVSLLSAEATIIISADGMSSIERKLTFPLTHRLKGEITVPVEEKDEYQVEIVSKPHLYCWKPGLSGFFANIITLTSCSVTLKSNCPCNPINLNYRHIWPFSDFTYTPCTTPSGHLIIPTPDKAGTLCYANISDDPPRPFLWFGYGFAESTNGLVTPSRVRGLRDIVENQFYTQMARSGVLEQCSNNSLGIT